MIAASCADYRAGASRDHDQADHDAGRKLACPLLVLWGRCYLSAKDAAPLHTWRDWAEDPREVPLDCGHFVAEEAPDLAPPRSAISSWKPDARAPYRDGRWRR